jgi:hypothetical protein
MAISSTLHGRHVDAGDWELHDDGPYAFPDGYWASEVGWYGGINHGFGYPGVGFACGEWRNGNFA